MGMDHTQEIQGWAEDGRLLKCDSKLAKEMGVGGRVGRAQGNYFKLRLWWWLLNFLYILKPFYLVNFMTCELHFKGLVMDREAWHAAVRGVAKSQTGLSDWTERYVYKTKPIWGPMHLCQKMVETPKLIALLRSFWNIIDILRNVCMHEFKISWCIHQGSFLFKWNALRKLKIKFVQVIWYHCRVTWRSPFIMLNFYNIWITHWVCKVVVLFCWKIFKY